MMGVPNDYYTATIACLEHELEIVKHKADCMRADERERRTFLSAFDTVMREYPAPDTTVQALVDYAAAVRVSATAIADQLEHADEVASAIRFILKHLTEAYPLLTSKGCLTPAQVAKDFSAAMEVGSEGEEEEQPAHALSAPEPEERKTEIEDFKTAMEIWGEDAHKDDEQPSVESDVVPEAEPIVEPDNSTEEDKPMPRHDASPTDKPEPERAVIAPPPEPQPESLPEPEIATPLEEVRRHIAAMLTAESPLVRSEIQTRLAKAGVIFAKGREVATLMAALRDSDQFVCPAPRIGWKLANGKATRPDKNQFGQLIYELLRTEQPRTINNICACLLDSGVKPKDGALDQRVRQTLQGRREFRQLPNDAWVLTSYQPSPVASQPRAKPITANTVERHRAAVTASGRRKKGDAAASPTNITMRECPRCEPHGQMLKRQETGTYGDWHWQCAQCGYEIDPDEVKVKPLNLAVSTTALQKLFLESMVPLLSSGWVPQGLISLDDIGDISRASGSGLNKQAIYDACKILGLVNAKRAVIAEELLECYEIRRKEVVNASTGNDGRDAGDTSGDDSDRDDIGADADEHSHAGDEL